MLPDYKQILRILPCFGAILLLSSRVFAQTENIPKDIPSTKHFIVAEFGVWNNTASELRNLQTILPDNWRYSPSVEVYFGKNVTPHFQMGLGLVHCSASISYRDTILAEPGNYNSAVSEVYTRRSFTGAGLRLGLHQDAGAFRLGASLTMSAGLNGKMQQQCNLDRTYYYSAVAAHSQNYTESKVDSVSFASFTALNAQLGYNFGRFTVYATTGVACWLARPVNNTVEGVQKTQLDPSYRLGIEYRL